MTGNNRNSTLLCPTMPGSKDPDSDVARACGEMLANPPTPKT